MAACSHSESSWRVVGIIGYYMGVLRACRGPRGHSKAGGHGEQGSEGILADIKWRCRG